MGRLALHVALIVTVLAGIAVAQPPPPDRRAQARAAFARAVAAEERKEWRTAVEEYLDAYELAPHPDVLFNIAVVYEKLDDARQAGSYYQRYLDEAPSAPDRGKVERVIKNLQRRTSKVKVDSTPRGAVLVVDGTRMGRTPAELELGGGTHELVAEQGGASARQQITLAYGEPQSIMLVVGGQGVLVVGSNEAGASVRIDGNPVGVTPWRGELAPGRHDVVVEKPGFTTVERVVDVPPDGTAQITAGMVRPLGYIEPTEPRKNLGVLLGFDGGLPLVEGGEAVFDLTFGWRSGGNRADAFTGLAFGSGGVGYALGARLYFATHRVRPYIGVGAGLVTQASHARATAGVMLADLGSGKTAWDLHLEAGVVTTAGTSDADERASGAMILAGVIWHLRPPAPAAPAALVTGR